MRSSVRIFLVASFIASAGFTVAKPHPAVIVNASEIVDRHLSGFNAINVAGPFDVDITQGTTESVKVEAPADVIERVLTEVNGGVLKIYNKHDTWNWGDWFGHNKKILVHVTVKDLNEINISGSGDVAFREGIAANSLKLRISGSGDMSGKVTVKTLESSISGSGDMRLSGKADNSTVSVVGSGDFRAGSLLTESTAVRVSGSGDANVNVTNSLNASISGSGDIRYTGGAKNILTTKSGSGDIERH